MVIINDLEKLFLRGGVAYLVNKNFLHVKCHGNDESILKNKLTMFMFL